MRWLSLSYSFQVTAQKIPLWSLGKGKERMEVLGSLIFPEVAANEESENRQYPSSLAFPAPGRWVSRLQLQCWSPRADPFQPQPLEEGNELSLSSDTFVLILSVLCCLLTGDRWLIMQLGTAHYVPISGLLNHFEILNSLINILWRAQDSDQACFSPGCAHTHRDRRMWVAGGVSPIWRGLQSASSWGQSFSQARTQRALASHGIPVDSFKGEETWGLRDDEIGLWSPRSWQNWDLNVGCLTPRPKLFLWNYAWHSAWHIVAAQQISVQWWTHVNIHKMPKIGPNKSLCLLSTH